MSSPGQFEIDRVEPFQQKEGDEENAGTGSAHDAEKECQGDIDYGAYQAVDQPGTASGDRPGRVEFEPDTFRRFNGAGCIQFLCNHVAVSVIRR